VTNLLDVTVDVLENNLFVAPDRYVDQTLDLTGYLNPCIFKGFKYYAEAEAFWFHLEEDESVTVRCAASAMADEDEYKLVAQGNEGECFFKSQPQGEPAPAPFWHTRPTSAESAWSDFIATTKSVGKELKGMESGFIRVHGHATSPEARDSIKSSWDRYREDAPPPVGGTLPNPRTTLTWPPPCFHMIKQSRVSTTNAVSNRTPPASTAAAATGVGGGMAAHRVTSNVPSVQQQQEAISSRGFIALVQPKVKVGKFYVVLQNEDPKLWIGEVISIVASGRVDKKARLLPATRGSASYWEHVKHSCVLRGQGDWADVEHPMSCSGNCAAGGTANIRYYYPVDDDIDNNAQMWAKSLLEDDLTEEPKWVKGYWKKRRSERIVNEVLGNIGPELDIITSCRGSTVRLKVASQSILKATALQLLASKHPWYN
jgi:hypothetical protein